MSITQQCLIKRNYVFPPFLLLLVRLDEALVTTKIVFKPTGIEIGIFIREVKFFGLTTAVFSKCLNWIGFCEDWATLLTKMTRCCGNDVEAVASSSLYCCIAATDSGTCCNTPPGACPKWDCPSIHIHLWADEFPPFPLTALFYSFCLIHYVTALLL